MKRILGIVFLFYFLASLAAFADESSNLGVEVINDKLLNVSLRPVNQTTIILDEIIYKESSRYYDLIDPVKQAGVSSYYPGLRGPNQLVVYTPMFGYRTGTNEFGTEAIVENNMVVSLNGADSVIPKNGFVLSGHGTAKKWLTENVQVGSKVYIDYSSKTIKTFLTPESLIFAAKEKLTEVNDVVEYYKNIDILYNDKKAVSYLEEAKECLRKAEKKPEKTQQYINEAMEKLNFAIKNAIPYYHKDIKGVWVRPVETSASDIARTVSRMKDAGLTDIFLETYFHGKTIYPSEYLKKVGVIPQKEEFVGFDPLEVWIKEAHKRGLKLHVWFETFYVGNDDPKVTPNHVLSVYPLWSNKRLMNYDSLEPVSSLSEHNGYFLDPANPQVQMHLVNILKELVLKYKPDGVNLDYIRYPQTVEPTFSNYAVMNWGYTYAARQGFKSLYGIDPVDIKYGTGDWELWATYRQNQISSFIQEARKITKPLGINLTAVIFPDIKKSISTKMQNWRSWAVNGYLDGVTPLILTGDKNTADLLIKDVVKNTYGRVNIYSGLFVPFMGGADEDLLMQIHKSRAFKTKGSVLFDYAHLDDIYVDALKTRVYNKTYDSRDIVKESEEYTPQVKYGSKKKKKSRKKDKKRDKLNSSLPIDKTVIIG